MSRSRVTAAVEQTCHQMYVLNQKLASGILCVTEHDDFSIVCLRRASSVGNCYESHAINGSFRNTRYCV